LPSSSTISSTALCVHLPLGEPDAAPQPVEQLLGGHARHLHQILLLHAVARMGEQVREAAVVRDQDQPLAHPIEPADREQPLVAGHEVHDAGPAGGIVVGRHHAHGLVEHEHDPLGVRQPLPIDADFLGVRIDAGAELRDHLAIDLDAARRDQLLAGPAAAQARGRQHLLQPLQAVVGDCRPGRLVREGGSGSHPAATGGDFAGPLGTRRAWGAGRASRPSGAGAAGGAVIFHGCGSEWGRRSRDRNGLGVTDHTRPADHRGGCDHHRDLVTSGTGSE
jgi:hypothetical protein